MEAFLNNYACGNFDPTSIPKKPKRLSCVRSIIDDNGSIDLNLISPSPSSDGNDDGPNNYNYCNNFFLNLNGNSTCKNSKNDKKNNLNNSSKLFDADNSHHKDANDDTYNIYLPPPMPPNETERMRALWRLQILNTSSDVNFTRLVGLVKEHFKVPISLISLVNESNQWFKAKEGLGDDGTPREVSFCGHAILQEGDEPFVVPDALLDWRFKNNPLVVDAPHIRFYAGAPLRTNDGYNIGTVCVIDTKPCYSFDEKDCETLRDFAKVVMRELELWADRLRLRVRNKMQESIAKFGKYCLEIQLAHKESSNNIIEHDEQGDPIMKHCFQKAVKLIKDTLEVDALYLLEMPSMSSKPINTSTDNHHSPSSSNEFISPNLFNNSSSPQSSLFKNLKFLAAEGLPIISGDDDSLNTPMTVSFLTRLMETHPQGYTFQNGLPSIPSLFPNNMHSGIVVPIYDNAKIAFGFLVCLTKDAFRQFEDEERVYLGNFGVNIVSEVLKRRVIVADRAKSTFISSVSHELRTPLHGILASCELMMEESKLKDSQLELLKTIQGCGTSLISIINSVLDYAKLESEQYRHRSLSISSSVQKQERIDLVKVLEEVTEACVVGQHMVSAVYARRRRVSELLHHSTHKQDRNESHETVEVILDVDTNEKGWVVMGEDGPIRQINSLKFTQEGYVHLSLTSVRSCSNTNCNDTSCFHSYDENDNNSNTQSDKDDDKLHVLFTITDTGKGISPHFLTTKLFQPFSQEDSLKAGTGLGLCIVKLLVEKMGGKLDVESELSVGTRIKIWLNFNQVQGTKFEHETILNELKEKNVIVKCVKGKFKKSIGRFFKNWLKVENVVYNEEDDKTSSPIFFITSLARHSKISDIIESIQNEIERKNSAILKNQSQNLGRNRKRRKVVVVSTPCGPRKLISVIISCYKKLKEENSNSLLLNKQIMTSPQFIMTPPPLENEGNGGHGHSNQLLEKLIIDPPLSAIPIAASIRSITLPLLPLSTSPPLPKFLPVLPPHNNQLNSHTTTTTTFVYESDQDSSSSASGSVIDDGILQSNKVLEVIAENQPPPTPRSPIVLIVEDNAVNRMILATFLKKRCIEYEEAENGEIGVEKFRNRLEEEDDCKKEESGCISYGIKKKSFDIVLMDIQMPVMNGNVATAKIRKLEQQRRMMGLASEEDKELAYESGVDGFLTKPVSLKMLEQIFKKWSESSISNNGSGYGSSNFDSNP
nr:6615_t:CDS:10 [Entrophospora candida]